MRYSFRYHPVNVSLPYDNPYFTAVIRQNAGRAGKKSITRRLIGETIRLRNYEEVTVEVGTSSNQRDGTRPLRSIFVSNMASSNKRKGCKRQWLIWKRGGAGLLMLTGLLPVSSYQRI